MLLTYLGEIAALLASICFAIGPTFNTLATRLAKVTTVNRARLIFTFLLLLLPHWLMQGALFPTTVPLNNLFWLGLSGLFALVLGDTLLFEAFNRIGTRLSMLIISLIPVISSTLAWFILDEKLSWIQATGILGGVRSQEWQQHGGRSISLPAGDIPGRRFSIFACHWQYHSQAGPCRRYAGHLRSFAARQHGLIDPDGSDAD